MAVDPSSRVPPAPAPERELTSLLGNYVVFHDCDKPPVALYVAGIDSTSNEVVLISEKAGGGGDVKRIDVQHFKQELAEQTYVVPAKARQMRTKRPLKTEEEVPASGVNEAPRQPKKKLKTRIFQEKESERHGTPVPVPGEPAAESGAVERQKTSRFIGVSWNRVFRAWRAKLGLEGKIYYLGDHKTEEKAARTRDKKVIELKGAGKTEDKDLNYPRSDYIRGDGTLTFTPKTPTAQAAGPQPKAAKASRKAGGASLAMTAKVSTFKAKSKPDKGPIERGNIVPGASASQVALAIHGLGGVRAPSAAGAPGRSVLEMFSQRRDATAPAQDPCKGRQPLRALRPPASGLGSDVLGAIVPDTTGLLAFAPPWGRVSGGSLTAGLAPQRTALAANVSLTHSLAASTPSPAAFHTAPSGGGSKLGRSMALPLAPLPYPPLPYQPPYDGILGHDERPLLQLANGKIGSALLGGTYGQLTAAAPRALAPPSTPCTPAAPKVQPGARSLATPSPLLPTADERNFEGVVWSPGMGLWRAEAEKQPGGALEVLGYCADAEDAARVRDFAVFQWHGPSAVLNFPICLQSGTRPKTSPFRGVSKDNSKKFGAGGPGGPVIGWRARIKEIPGGGGDTILGVFSTAREAAVAWDLAAMRVKGVRMADTNFPRSQELDPLWTIATVASSVGGSIGDAAPVPPLAGQPVRVFREGAWEEGLLTGQRRGTRWCVAFPSRSEEEALSEKELREACVLTPVAARALAPHAAGGSVAV